jgi:hypothetical protein
MQRSGSTLQFQITSHLVEMAGLGKRHEFMAPDEIPGVIGEDIAQYVVLKTHVFSDAIGAAFTRGQALGIYCFRDLRDVIVSFMHKEQKAFAEKWVLSRIDNNLRWYTYWTAQPRMLVSRYETLIADLPGEVARIASHLGIKLDQTTCQKIAELYSIDRQRQTIAEAIQAQRLQSKVGQIFDPHSLLHTNHIRSGEVGGWKETLTPQQADFIEEHARDWMLQHGYLPANT